MKHPKKTVKNGKITWYIDLGDMSVESAKLHIKKLLERDKINGKS
jgi:hypothetical protein